MREKFRNIMFLLMAIVAILSFPKVARAEEALWIPQWKVDATLLENGDLQITEDITFEFNDDFNGVFRDIMLNKTSGITGITVRELEGGSLTDYSLAEDAENGDSRVFTLKENKNKVLIKIYSPSEDERKTFRISYLVKNVAVSYNDIGELYYKFVGDENETPIGSFIINVILPDAASDKEIKIFAHGPSNGIISKESDKIYQLQVDKVPSETLIEGRILFPKSFIASSTNHQNIDKYNDILNEEASLTKKLADDKVRKEAIRKLLGQISICISGFSFLLFIALLFRNRRGKSEDTYQGYSGIPQDCTPAIAALITGSMMGTNTVFATILDLVRKEYLGLSEDQQSTALHGNKVYLIHKRKEADNSLLKHERYFINWLINDLGDGLSVSTKDIEYFSKHSNAKFIGSYTNWKNQVKTDAAQQGYYDTRKKQQGSSLLLLLIPVFVLGVFTAVSGSVYAIADFIVAGLFFVYGLILLFSLSDYGYGQYCRWMTFKKHVKTHHPDLSKEEALNSQDPSLLYALSLNIVKEQRIPVRTDDDYSMNSWIFWYLLFVNNENNSFRKSIDKSFVSVDTSAGSGDGFSGGGGGGAGGGGAGGF